MLFKKGNKTGSTETLARSTQFFANKAFYVLSFGGAI